MPPRGTQFPVLPPGIQQNPTFLGRPYMAGTARFLTAARLAEQLGGEPPYAYALNNPVTYVDPDGNQAIVAGLGAFALADEWNPLGWCATVAVGCILIYYVCEKPKQITLPRLQPAPGPDPYKNVPIGDPIVLPTSRGRPRPRWPKPHPQDCQQWVNNCLGTKLPPHWQLWQWRKYCHECGNKCRNGGLDRLKRDGCDYDNPPKQR